MTDEPAATATRASDVAAIDAIVAGDEAAWRAFIAEHEARLRWYFTARVGATTADDLTQETFVAFYTALPNFDRDRPPGPLLRAIAANKLTDHLRRSGRRPALPVDFGGSEYGGLSGGERAVSSVARSQEQRGREEAAVAETLADLIAAWRQGGAWERLAVAELTILAGWSSKDAAARLSLTEQTVANHRSYIRSQLKTALQKAGHLAIEV